MNEDSLRGLLVRLRDFPRESEWDALYQLIWPYVFTIMYRALGGQRYIAEEGTQEVMLRLVRHLDLQRTEPRQFLSYVSRVCVSVRADLMRREQSARAVAAVGLPGSDERDYEIADRRSDPEQLCLIRNNVETALSRLSNPERRIAKLLLEGRTKDEISRLLGRSEKTTSNLLSALRVKLRRLLFSPYKKTRAL